MADIPDNLMFIKYPLEDFRTDNSFSNTVDLICNMPMLKREVPMLFESINRIETGGNYAQCDGVAMHFIDTPKVPLSMQSAIQILKNERIDSKHAKMRVAFLFKLRNPSIRADYRDENLPPWWDKALEYIQTNAMPEIGTAILLYADVLAFFDRLLLNGTFVNHATPMPFIRREIFFLAISMLLKQHNCFKSTELLFSTEAKKAVVRDIDGHKIKKCENCKNNDSTLRLLTCGKCASVRYCSKECQRDHWAEHKSFCKAICEEAGAKLETPLKHYSVATDAVERAATVEGPEGEVIMNQLKELFRHVCLHCHGWLKDTSKWDNCEGFCSRVCARRFAEKWPDLDS